MFQAAISLLPPRWHLQGFRGLAQNAYLMSVEHLVSGDINASTHKNLFLGFGLLGRDPRCLDTLDSRLVID